MLGFWSQAANALLVQQGQSGGRGPQQAPHCDGGQEPSWAQQEREGFFFRKANRSVFSQPAFSSSDLCTPSFLGSLLADWYIRWNVLFLSFYENWLFFLNCLLPSPLSHFQPFSGKLNQTMTAISQSSCVTSKSLAEVCSAFPFDDPDKFPPFSCLKSFSFQLPI